MDPYGAELTPSVDNRRPSGRSQLNTDSVKGAIEQCEIDIQDRYLLNYSVPRDDASRNRRNETRKLWLPSKPLLSNFLRTVCQSQLGGKPFSGSKKHELFGRRDCVQRIRISQMNGGLLSNQALAPACQTTGGKISVRFNIAN